MREYDSFESALRDSDSYEDPRLIEVVFRKTKSYREALSSNQPRVITSRQVVQNMFVLSYIEPHHPLNVLEFGGACGASYFELKYFFPERIKNWSIVETPAMVAAGNRLTNEHGPSFHCDFESATSVLEQRDLAIAQGVLQYAGDSLQMLTDLFQFQFSYVYVTRTTVAVDATIERPIITKQETNLSAHGPGNFPTDLVDGKSSQPLTIASLDSISSRIPGCYELLYWDDRVLLIGGRLVTVRDIGFLAKKR